MREAFLGSDDPKLLLSSRLVEEELQRRASAAAEGLASIEEGQ